MRRTVLSIFAVIPTRIGGVESYARELSAQLGQQGWSSVLTFEAPPAEPVREYLALPNTTVEVLADTWRRRLAPARGLARLLRHYRPAILHLQFTGFLSLYPWLARWHGVRKIFFTDQTSRPEGHIIELAPAWKRGVTRIVNMPLTSVISISDFNRRCVVDAGLLSGSRVVRIYNGVDLLRRVGQRERAAEFRRRHRIPDGRTVVLQVSWIIPEKGIEDLLRAARRVIGEGVDAHFVLVGEGDSREDYTRLAENMGIGGHVSWTGPVTDPFAEGVYAAADVVCQMSRWEEGFGWVIAEAMACGRPTVATRVGAIPELVSDGETGFLVNRGDGPAMADALIKLIRDRDLRARLGKAGRDTAEAKFDLRKNVAQVLSVYGIGRGESG